MNLPSVSVVAAAAAAVGCWPRCRPMSRAYLAAVAALVIRRYSIRRFQPNRNQANGDLRQRRMRRNQRRSSFGAAAGQGAHPAGRCAAGVVVVAAGSGD